MHLVSYIFGALTCIAIVFYFANLLALRSWRMQRVPPPKDIPISVLKPLKGADPEMYECFRTHCEQQYSAPYEIIFGVNDNRDEAILFVEQLKREYPQNRISLVVCSEALGANRKVSNLAQMAKIAKYDHLVANDSDISVPRDYLSGVARWFTLPKTGMVTCLYRGVPGESLWSKVEGLGVLADFMPGALTARMIEGGVHFGLGSTMAVSRDALNAIGGFETLADYLADDYELSAHVIRAGFDVRLADVVVETNVADHDWSSFWKHQIRWGRTVRSSRFGGYVGLAVTFGLFWALVWVIASKVSFAACVGLFAVLIARVIVLFTYARALDAWESAQSWRLFVLRDLIAPFVWMASIGGSSIEWRGERFKLRNGKLQRL